MGSATLVDNEDHTNGYYCSQCDYTHWEEKEPMKGYWFDIANTASRVDSDGDPFIEGDTKILKGRKTYCCHSEYPHYIDSDEWAQVTCEAWQCDECGEQYTFDNEYCHDHMYSVSEDAESRAKKCCAAGSGKQTKTDLYDLEKLSQPKSERSMPAVSFTTTASTGASSTYTASVGTPSTTTATSITQLITPEQLQQAINNSAVTLRSGTVTFSLPEITITTA